MATNPVVPTAKRKRGDLTVLSANVQGVDPDELARAVKKLKPDIVALQEAPKSGHALYSTLNKALNELNTDKTSNTEYKYSKPQIVPEFFSGAHFISPKVGVYPDQSVKKNYCLFYNEQKLQEMESPALLDYGKDKNWKADAQSCKDSFDATQKGYGARPPVRAKYKLRNGKKKIALFAHHAPTINDPFHGASMKMFEGSAAVQDSKMSDHMTIVCGDLNDQLQNNFKDFKEGVDHKFDHVIAHNASSHYDLLQDHSAELNAACTSTQDHFPMACEFNFK